MSLAGIGGKAALVLGASIAVITGDAFAEVEGDDRIEFVDRVARRIPARTILKLLGLPQEVYSRLHHWPIAFNAALGGIDMPEEVVVEGEKVLLEMREIFLPEIEARRRRPSARKGQSARFRPRPRCRTPGPVRSHRPSRGRSPPQ